MFGSSGTDDRSALKTLKVRRVRGDGGQRQSPWQPLCKECFYWVCESRAATLSGWSYDRVMHPTLIVFPGPLMLAIYWHHSGFQIKIEIRSYMPGVDWRRGQDGVTVGGPLMAVMWFAGGVCFLVNDRRTKYRHKSITDIKAFCYFYEEDEIKTRENSLSSQFSFRFFDIYFDLVLLWLLTATIAGTVVGTTLTLMLLLSILLLLLLSDYQSSLLFHITWPTLVSCSSLLLPVTSNLITTSVINNYTFTCLAIYPATATTSTVTSSQLLSPQTPAPHTAQSQIPTRFFSLPPTSKFLRELLSFNHFLAR